MAIKNIAMAEGRCGNPFFFCNLSLRWSCHEKGQRRLLLSEEERKMSLSGSLTLCFAVVKFGKAIKQNLFLYEAGVVSVLFSSFFPPH